MPSEDNHIATNISSRKYNDENVWESCASVTRRSKEVCKSKQKKDDLLDRSIDNSAEHSCENKSIRDSEVDFS